MPKVYIPNKGPHDYSAAEEFGDLVFLTTGAINRFDVDKMKELMWTQLRRWEDDDYWMISSLTILNVVGIAGIVSGGGCPPKLLLLKNGRYIVREL